MIEIRELIIRATAGAGKQEKKPAEESACNAGATPPDSKKLKKQIDQLSQMIADKNER